MTKESNDETLDSGTMVEVELLHPMANTAIVPNIYPMRNISNNFYFFSLTDRFLAEMSRIPEYRYTRTNRAPV